MGVSIQDMSKELADSFGLSKPAGALINTVEKGGPAERAGILPGDVILRFDGKPIVLAADLPRAVGLTRPGSKVPVQVWRAGASRELSLVVGEMQIDEKLSANGAKRQGRPEAAANRLGLVLRELGPEQRRTLGVSGGLIVDDVRNGAARTDLRPGDLIRAVVVKGVQTELSSVDQFNAILTKFDRNETVTLWVRRGDTQLFVTIKPVTSRQPEGADAG
jgi:serine protease Do